MKYKSLNKEEAKKEFGKLLEELQVNYDIWDKSNIFQVSNRLNLYLSKLQRLLINIDIQSFHKKELQKARNDSKITKNITIL